MSNTVPYANLGQQKSFITAQVPQYPWFPHSESWVSGPWFSPYFMGTIVSVGSRDRGLTIMFKIIKFLALVLYKNFNVYLKRFRSLNMGSDEKLSCGALYII